MGPDTRAQARTGALDLAWVNGVPNWDTEGAARDWVTPVVYVDIVVPRCEGDVLYAAAAIFVVLARDFGL